MLERSDLASFPVSPFNLKLSSSALPSTPLSRLLSPIFSELHSRAVSSVEAGEELQTGASIAASMSGDIRILKIRKRERIIFGKNYF